MKIGIDASRLRSGATGVGRYTAGILAPLDKALPDSTFVLYARRDYDVVLPSERWSVRLDRHPVWSRLPVTYWIHYRLGTIVRRDDLDVLWTPNTLIPRNVTQAVPCVTTVLDFRHEFAPDDLPPVTRRAHKKWFRNDVGQAVRVVAISEGTSQRMRELFGRRADAIASPAVPILPPVLDRGHALHQLAGLGVQQPFLLTVGRSACKNLSGVVNAITLMKARGQLKGYQLVMVGAKAWTERGDFAKDVRNVQWIKPVGFVDDATLAILYSLSEALVFPSFYEGFGIPVAEARSVGCRVVTTDSPELREAGGTDATYVEPTPEGIATGLQAALSRSPPPSHRLNHGWADAALVMAAEFRSAARRSL